ncbi:hypothetical protein AB0L09_38455 [Streptomyces zaomyceticus]
MSAKLRETQESEAAEAALGRLQCLSRNFPYLHSECGLVRTALNGLAADLAAPQNQLKQALAEAAALKFTVNADGSVTFPATEVTDLTWVAKEAPGSSVRGSSRLPPEPPGFGAQGSSPLYPDHSFVKPLNPNAAKAQDIADRVARAVRSAAEIDARYATTLSGLRADKGLDVTAATLKDVARDTADVRSTAGTHLGAGVPEDKSPAERKAKTPRARPSAAGASWSTTGPDPWATWDSWTPTRSTSRRASTRIRRATSPGSSAAGPTRSARRSIDEGTGTGGTDRPPRHHGGCGSRGVWSSGW